MTHPKDMNEHPGESRPDEAELMLVDLLYGELEDSEQEHALERVRERELDGELDGLKQLRAMLRELPEEEPPAAVSAKLLHAAAVHAAGHAARPAARKRGADEGERKGILAWLSSLIRPLAMYPGLAAATTLLLVVGVAGTVYLSGRDQLAEPRVSSPGATPPIATMAAPEQAPEQAWPANELEAVLGDGKAEQTQTGTGSADPLGPSAGAVSGNIVDSEEQAKPRPAEPKGATSKLSRKRSASDYRSTEKTTAKSAEPDAEIARAAGESSGRGAGASYGANAPATRAPARSTARAKDSSGVEAQAPAADMAGDMDDRYQAPAEKAPPQAEGRRDEPADKAPVSKPSTQNSAARIRSLHDEARSAAANGQCDVVRNVAAMIRKLDERYYQGTYLRDKALSTCLGKSAR
jgi:hypothetical protein